ncbi:MAG: hypothetical protein JNL82_35360 [Myxococcales bacterium]|nr:hypothetical protein [Myxococcales bacterium]
MNRAYPVCLISALLIAACGGSGEDDSGDTPADTGNDPSGIPLPSNPTPAGTDEGESTADPPTSGSETGGSESGSTTMDLNCGVADIKAEVTIPRVMLVLDKSGSMVANPYGFWDADGDDADDDGFKDADPATMATPKVTRWQSLYETVDFIVTGFEERMDFGAVLFPAIDATKDYDARACPVDADPTVPVGPDQGAVILGAIPAADNTAIRGGTPAAAGIVTGVAGLATDDPAEADKPKYLIFITDGAANCPIEPVDAMDSSLFEIYDANLPVVVADALGQGIPTYVVGIDIEDVVSVTQKDGNPDATNTFEKLNEVAVAGGQARPGDEKFYNTANQVELQAALMSISELITSCTFELNKPLLDSQYVEKLEVDPDGPSPLLYGLMQVTDCATESGWHFTDETRTAIELCGDACTLYKQTGDVNIVFECQAG